MEFPQIGGKCFWEACQSLDFLPIKCFHCNNDFCKNHFNPVSHECQSVVQQRPPSCSSNPKNFICTMVGCKTSELVEMPCIKCNNHFCLIHRYHDCFNYGEDEILEARKRSKLIKEKFEEQLNKVNVKIDENIEKKLKSTKNQQTALKVQLMRLKGKAVGVPNVPTATRIYLLVVPPLSFKVAAKAVYVSEDWSVGRAIDAIASLCNITNRNNEAKAKKLRLFKKEDGLPIATDMSSTIMALCKVGKIVNGQTVILEYVEPDENLDLFSLSNVTDYLE